MRCVEVEVSEACVIEGEGVQTWRCEPNLRLEALVDAERLDVAQGRVCGAG